MNVASAIKPTTCTSECVIGVSVRRTASREGTNENWVWLLWTTSWMYFQKYSEITTNKTIELPGRRYDRSVQWVAVNHTKIKMNGTTVAYIFLEQRIPKLKVLLRIQPKILFSSYWITQRYWGVCSWWTTLLPESITIIPTTTWNLSELLLNYDCVIMYWNGIPTETSTGCPPTYT